jgi:hypothetical protein
MSFLLGNGVYYNEDAADLRHGRALTEKEHAMGDPSEASATCAG